jgi:hypothetical protein
VTSDLAQIASKRKFQKIINKYYLQKKKKLMKKTIIK